MIGLTFLFFAIVWCVISIRESHNLKTNTLGTAAVAARRRAQFIRLCIQLFGCLLRQASWFFLSTDWPRVLFWHLLTYSISSTQILNNTSFKPFKSTLSIPERIIDIASELKPCCTRYTKCTIRTRNTKKLSEAAATHWDRETRQIVCFLFWHFKYILGTSRRGLWHSTLGCRPVMPRPRRRKHPITVNNYLTAYSSRPWLP